ncbi:hypothetical protein [Endozoicomonas sp. YOMI1]|uniref:hypothetical protein n=1 Tax=Endozoicomonas sp. YOMI1 TaxID=2828739 RepID=UPI002148A446|nr:hypothetical protein [Endozoicomonas sp. YOMI1]
MSIPQAGAITGLPVVNESQPAGGITEAYDSTFKSQFGGKMVCVVNASEDALTKMDNKLQLTKNSLFTGSSFSLSSVQPGENDSLPHEWRISVREEAGKFSGNICQINFDPMHYGYILDFGRELSFRHIEELMGNILKLEQKKDNLSGGEFREPVKLSLFNSYQGVMSPPVQLSRAQVQQLQNHTHAFSRYGCVIGHEQNLYQLLSQSGSDRFLKLLENIPKQVSTVAAEVGEDDIDIQALLTAIEHYDSAEFMTALSALNNGFKSKFGLPNRLLETLIKQYPIKEHFPSYIYDGTGCTYKQRRVELSMDHILKQTKSTFAEQAVICRELLKHKLFVPFLLGSPYHAGISFHNPLVCCLLIAHGTRVHLTHHPVLSDCSLLIFAMHFYRMNLLTVAEVDTVRHEMLWTLLCHSENGPITDPDEIVSRLITVEEELHRYQDLCRRFDGIHRQLDELFGLEFYFHFVANESDDGHAIKEFLKKELSTRRYSDEQVREHLEHTSTLTSSKPVNFITEFLGKLYYEVPPAAVVRLRENGECQPDWLETFLTSPPYFKCSEHQSNDKDRYREITLVAGHYYYQCPHPKRAQTILVEGTKPYYRTLHGLDHALRTQMAIEFLLDDHVLPQFHRPFKELLDNQPQLRELLPIAELYHDAVAEDEPKEVEELRAAELFHRDMTSLQQYPDELIALVATALRNKNCEAMNSGNPLFSHDHQCPEEELLLRQVLRFGDIVDTLSQEGFSTIKPTSGSAAMGSPEMIHDNDDHPEMIELLDVVNNRQFTMLIRAALSGFRNLASITGGWHQQTANPFTSKYGLPVDNHKRRLLIEQAPDPYGCLHECLNDLVRFIIARKANVTAHFPEYSPRSHENSWLPDYQDPDIDFSGAYRSLHNEEELRQIRLPEAMTLAEKIIAVAEQRKLEKFIAPATSEALKTETMRLHQEGILPTSGTPSQLELQRMFRHPDTADARLLSERGYGVKFSLHEGKTCYHMTPKPKRSHSELAQPSSFMPPDNHERTATSCQPSKLTRYSYLS